MTDINKTYTKMTIRELQKLSPVVCILAKFVVSRSKKVPVMELSV